MKKFLVTSLMLFVFVVGIVFTGTTATYAKSYKKAYSGKKYKKQRRYRSKQTCRTPRRSSQSRSSNRYRRSNVRNSRTAGYTYKKPSFYRRHRNASNIAIGTGGGALIGALVGGKKGALIGAGIGAGSSALYTYKIKPKKRNYRSRYTRRN